MTDKVLLPARERSLDQIMKAYESLEKHSTPADLSLRERTSKDPLGLNEEVDKSDPRKNAKEVVERVVKFFMLASEEWALGPKEMIYAAELIGVNILNAQNIPLTAAQIQKERDDAVQYYEESLPKIPSK